MACTKCHHHKDEILRLHAVAWELAAARDKANATRFVLVKNTRPYRRRSKWGYWLLGGK